MLSRGRGSSLGFPKSIRPYANKANKPDKNKAHGTNTGEEGVMDKQALNSPRSSTPMPESPALPARDLSDAVPMEEWLQRVSDAREQLAHKHGKGKHELEWQKQWDPPRVRPTLPCAMGASHCPSGRLPPYWTFRTYMRMVSAGHGRAAPRAGCAADVGSFQRLLLQHPGEFRHTCRPLPVPYVGMYILGVTPVCC